VTPKSTAMQLPQGLSLYKMTPLFDAASTPPALQADHSTKAGVWGRIHVLSGRLCYRVTDSRRTAAALDLSAGAYGIIEPTIVHRVELDGEVSFQVEFWK